MVPRVSVLGDPELVRVFVIRGDGALRDAIYAVIFELVYHPNPVPMNSGAVVVEVVDDRDLEGISPARLNPRTGILLIESLATVSTHVAIGIDRPFVNVERILGGNSESCVYRGISWIQDILCGLFLSGRTCHGWYEYRMYHRTDSQCQPDGLATEFERHHGRHASSPSF